MPRLDLHGDRLPDGAIARLGTVRFQPPAYATTALSPDGTMLAAASYVSEKEGTWVEFMDTATGKTVRRLRLAHVSNDFMGYSPDGKGLIFKGWSDFSQYDLATGKKAWSLKEGQYDSRFAISLDGKLVAFQAWVFTKDAPVRVLETATGKEVAVLPGRGASCAGLVFSGDGKRLLLRSHVPTTINENSMSFGGDNAKDAYACIDIGAGKIVGETTAGAAYQAALCPDGETIALEDADHRAIRILHLPSGAERCTISVKPASFAFAPGGKVLLTVDPAGWVAMWDAAQGTKIRDLEGQLASKDHRLVGFSANGKTIAIRDGGWFSAATLVVWDADTGQRARRPPGHDGAVTCVAYTSDGKHLASGSLDKTVRLWNAATGEHLRVLVEHKDSVTAVAFSPDGKLVASSSKDSVTRVTHVADGKPIARFDGPEHGATALAFTPDGKALLAGGSFPEVLAWQVAGGTELIRLKTGDDGNVMAFANGGGLAVTANGEIRAEDTPERLLVWNPNKKLPIAIIPLRGPDGHGKVRCEAALFSPDGRLIAASQVSEYQGIRPSYGASLLRVWERGSGQQIATLAPAVSRVLAFSPNGRLLASGSAGRPGHLNPGYGAGIDIWDVVTGKKVAELDATPHCLAFSPQGSRIATAGWDKSILIWEAPRVQPPRDAKAPSTALRELWWSALGGNAADAYKAIGQMLDAPDHAVTFLKECVPPVQPPDAAAVAKLIGVLDSDKFAERDKARIALEKLGDAAAHLLQEALAGKTTEEMRRRLKVLLAKCEVTSMASLRQHRAVATLEWIATPAARAVLQALADGAPSARLTAEARAALKRLQG
jgi:WD40 repeat protein